MTRVDILTEVKKQFGNVPRPGMFTGGTCKCEECLAHEEEMRTFDADNLPLDKLNNPGWDPICFASDEAFVYLLPGLVKLVLDHADDYLQQFLFHIEQPDRVKTLSLAQAQALIQLLDFLAIHEAEAVCNNLVVEDLNRVRKGLPV